MYPGWTYQKVFFTGWCGLLGLWLLSHQSSIHRSVLFSQFILKKVNRVSNLYVDVMIIFIVSILSLFFTGLVQGMASGVRGLCNGLGPAFFGVIFYLFDVNLNYSASIPTKVVKTPSNLTEIIQNDSIIDSSMFSRDIPGPPFLFGALLALLALTFSFLLPSSRSDTRGNVHETTNTQLEIRLLEKQDDHSNNLMENDWRHWYQDRYCNSWFCSELYCYFCSIFYFVKKSKITYIC